MTDLISREAALAAVMHMSDAYERIYVLPAAQVICTWPSCSHTARGQCQPLSPTPVDASQTPDPVVNEHDDPVCTCCGGTGITLQTERRCACQTPDPDTKMRCAECWCDGGECEWIATGNETEADPVINDPRVKALVELLREANDDLKAYVDADWPKEQRAQYPSYQRKWERDMELCKRIDAALSDVKDFLTADPLSDPRVKATEERLAFVLWKAEADRAAPNVGRTRTQEAFAEQLPQTREQWLGLARAALRAIGGEA